ncbi:MAG: DUF1934 domain-containing protein [Oscillospiraceae bacterium]|jgi:uncharacterized beta-barrel protein YwiB (DUF1934 family)|nr:DUF1934 domain-containing protein [Oscillospiraceae bacterium]MCX4257669.1 DUF1934 domain-containing protein [Oscillospiraceae bacterium]
MEKNVLINLTSINTVDDDSSKIELTTSGTLRSLKNGGFELKYEESEVTGFGGSTTSLTLLGNNLVNLNRTGTAPSDLILERNKKHHCHYGTPYGDFTMGIFTHCIDNNIGENGGDLYLKYTVDINSSYVSDNEIYIKIN